MYILVLQSRGLVALLCLSSCHLVIVVWLFLTMPRVCLQFMIVVFPDHTHLLFLLHCAELVPGLEVIKLEFIFILKIKRNDWLLSDTCPQSANHCALF